MHYSEDLQIESIILHKVGNKQRGEEMTLSKDLLLLNNETKQVLISYFLTGFKTEIFFNFFHENNLEFNEVYNYACEIFDNPDKFYDASILLTKHLYEKSTHPKIKMGEFYVVLFKNTIVEGEVIDSIGLFKSESKDTFLKIYPDNENFVVKHEDGINIKKLDKGCIIHNTSRESGFLVEVIDNISKGNEAVFWKDEFLNIRQRNDKYFQTENTMMMCKDFIVDKLPEEYEVSRADQADLLNKSADFFKKNQQFKIDEFANTVLEQPEIKESFNQYKSNYQEEWEMQLPEEFDIENTAVKKNQRILKSVIKLDKNFHIYVHGNRDLIIKGYDQQRGMHYYQVYYQVEN